MSRNPFGSALWALVGLGVLLAVFAALTGVLLGLIVVVGLAVLNLIYLPRAAARLRMTPGWLALMLIPCVVLIGVVVDGVPGAAWGAALWLLAIGVPRVIARDVGRRVRRRIDARREVYDVPMRASVPVTTPTERPGVRPLPPVDGPGRDEFVL